MPAILALQELPCLTALGLDAAIDDGDSCTVCSWTCDWTTCYCTSIEVA